MIKKSSKINKLMCIMMAMLFAFPFSISAATISEIEAQQAELAKQKEALQAELDVLREDEDKAKEYQETLQEQIDLSKKRIDTANLSIIDLNDSIKELEASLEKSALQYKDTMDELKSRIKAVYLAGETNTLEILLNSSSIYDFSIRKEALDIVAQHDQYLMDQIQVYIDETKTDRETLKKEKEQVAELKVQLESDQLELNDLFAENLKVLEELAELSGEKLDELEHNAEEDAKLDEQIAAIIAEEERKRLEELAASGQYDVETGTKLPGNVGISDFNPSWPVPGWGTNYITSYWGDGRNHQGLDIAANYGVPIVASEEGEVIEVFESSGWGKNVLIYHNGTYSTRYAHMSSFAVSVGDYVQQNEVIGYIGSTGHSTGNHLHFEIYKNGTRVDPYPYL